MLGWRARVRWSELNAHRLTCLSFISILTSFITCSTSLSFRVRILLQATCLCLVGSKARCTVAKEPVPRHWEVTIYFPRRWRKYDQSLGQALRSAFLAYLLRGLWWRGRIKNSKFLLWLSNNMMACKFCIEFVYRSGKQPSRKNKPILFGRPRTSPSMSMTEFFLICCPLYAIPLRDKSWIVGLPRTLFRRVE